MKQPGPPTPDVSFQRFTVHTTPISAGASNDEKSQTSLTIIKELEDRNHAGINVQTDGSLINTPKEKYQKIHGGERVSVIWDDGWYCPTKSRVQYIRRWTHILVSE